MKSFKYSIVIPVYNVEQYLFQCVMSVLSQSYRNIEIILVNDGSIDSSPMICDDFDKRDERIIVIHQENGGLSRARNAGIKHASGDYVMFLDSDDYYLNNDFIYKINEFLLTNECEMLMYQRQLYYEENKTFGEYPTIYSKSSIGINDVNIIYRLLTERDQLDASAAMKVINRKFLLDNQLYFKHDMYSEDVEWFFRLSNVVSKVMVINEPAYCYRIREGSISHTVTGKKIDDLFYSIEAYADCILSQPKSEKNQALLNYLAYQYFIVLGLTNANLDGHEKSIRQKKYKKYKWLVRYCFSPKTKLAGFICRIMGINVTSYILGRYIKSK